MKTKKVLSLTLAAVMAASLTACGGGSGDCCRQGRERA